MPASRKELIQGSLITRLKKITAANGYDTDVQKVYGGDDIPMGLSLEAHELPAILVINSNDKISFEKHCVVGLWEFEIQLIHDGDQPDAIMHRFARDVAKAIFADSPTAVRRDAYRTFDGKPTAWFIDKMNPDLNMIEGNRFTCMFHTCRYDLQSPTDF